MKQDVVPVVEIKSTFTYKGKTINTEFELSPDQKQALEDLIDWYKTSNNPIVLQGSAGVGKTAVIGYLQKYLKEPVLYTAPTHAATLQLTFATFKAGNNELASTIRSSVYEKRLPNGGTDILLTKKAADKIGFGKLIVVDESSMVSPDEQRLLRGLSEKGYKILYTGDKMQIPYVDTVNTKSKPVSAVFTNYKNINLEKVHRTKSNELIQLLSKIRESINQLYKIPDTDVVKFYNKELEFKNKFVEKLKEDPENTTYIAYTNKTVQSVNQAARKLLGRSGSPKIGDILTGYLGYASKQIEKGHLANSVLYSITNIKESGSTRVINFESAKLNDLKKKGIRGLSNVYRTEYYQLSREDSLNFEELTNEDFQKNNEEISKLFKELYDVYNQVQVTKNWDLWARTLRSVSETLAEKDLGSTYIYVPSKDKMVLYDSKIHAGIKGKYSFLYIEKGADYGHAITSHKSQGSTYDNVFVDAGSFKLIQSTDIIENGEVINTEKQAIAYVSLSRSAKELHVFEGAEDFEMLENTDNVSKSIKIKSNPTKLDSKFSPMQMSDKVYKVYNNLLDKYDFEFEPAMEEFRQMDNLIFEEVYVDNLGDSVYLVYESNEVNPSFRIAADRSIESAKELIYKDGVFTNRVEKADETNTNLPQVNIDKQQLKDCKNGL